MGIFQNIVRGGQLTMHGLRMLKQVASTLWICGLVSVVICTAIGLNRTTTSKEWIGYVDYQKARLFHHLSDIHWFKESNIKIHYNDKVIAVKARYIVNDWYFNEIKNKIERKTEESFILSLKITIGFLILLGIIFTRRGIKNSGEEHLRGAKFKLFKKVRSNIRQANRKENYKAFSIAQMPYPYQAECQHTLVVGANGVGKTVLISDLVEQIRKRGDKAIIYDKKGDYTKWFYNPKKDKILNPFDKRSEEWNLLAEIEHMGTIKQIAKAFIPDKGAYAGESKIWDEAARIAFTSIVEKFYSKGTNLTNREIVDKLLRADLNEAAKLVKNTYAQSTLSKDSPKTAASVLFVLAAHFNSLRLTNGKKENSFSIRDWILAKEQDSILFLTSQANLSDELSPLQTAWFEIAISSILSKENNKQKTWVILDELPTLGKIPSLQTALAVTRSYGGCFVLGMQNIAQMRERYGREITQDISSECNTRCIFKSNDPDTAKWLVDNIGSAEIREHKEGLSYGANTIRDGVSINTQDRIKNLLIPSEIQNLPRLSLYLKMPDHQAVKAIIKYQDRKEQEQGFIKNAELIEGLKDIYTDIKNVEEKIKKESDPESGSNTKTQEQEILSLVPDRHEDTDTTQSDKRYKLFND